MTAYKTHPVKRQITDAFMELMTKKSYMDITVTDIVNTAAVARASFYRNFDSIGSVIDTIVDEMSEEFIEDIMPTMNSTDERKWREFLFEHFYRFARRKRAMSDIGIRNMSLLFVRMDQKMKLLEDGSCKDMRQKYLINGKMGMINSITKKWMDTGMNETPEEMIDFIMSFIMF